MKKYLFVFIPTLFLIACGTDLNKEQGSSTDSTSETDVPSKIPLTELFLPDKSIATFKGDGNEYASFTLTTKYLYDVYVATYEDNGGTIVQKIYYISDDKISLLANNAEAYDVGLPSLSELQSMQEIDVYMVSPLSVGTQFNGWKITSTTETVETDLQTFEDVITIEKVDEQGSKTRKYFAKNYGEIKREYIMPEGDEPFIVTSTIESIK
ncbi:hypothetical protein [Bacillus sp. FJAT-22090]|uniref:hypothetical protein n=1 Tax=Bacillus sp. FJAT-22090 TaxID=1581038 RepID=UPI0011A183CD|nr:hypothetical protein [Bacillus sp. FJAT-22090]